MIWTSYRSLWSPSFICTLLKRPCRQRKPHQAPVQRNTTNTQFIQRWIWLDSKVSLYWRTFVLLFNRYIFYDVSPVTPFKISSSFKSKRWEVSCSSAPSVTCQDLHQLCSCSWLTVTVWHLLVKQGERLTKGQRLETLLSVRLKRVFQDSSGFLSSFEHLLLAATRD